MSNDIKEGVEGLEKLKEVLKFQYDYYKHMTTLSAGSILIIIAILKGVFEEPKGIATVMVSIVCFVLSLIGSLVIMSIIANLVLYLTGIYIAFIAGDLKDMKKVSDKAQSTTKKAKVFDILQGIFFLLGIAMLVWFTFINFL